MPDTCIKPYTKKESPYSKKDSFITKKDSQFSELCLDYTAKLLQDNSPFVFQDGVQYIFNE